MDEKLADSEEFPSKKSVWTKQGFLEAVKLLLAEKNSLWASSIIYSLVETAKLNNLNIYAYLETVLLYMPDYKNEPEGIEELMPWSDMIQQRCRIKSKS